MKIIIAGAGEVGTHLAKMLSSENQDIVLLDENESNLSLMESHFDLLTIKGNPISLNDLKQTGIEDADLFIAVTPEESKNMTACMLATNMGAKITLARIDNYEYLLAKNKDFFKKLGVDFFIYPEMLAAKEIVNSLKRNWVRQWMEFYGGELVLIGMKIRNNAPLIDKKLEKVFIQDKRMRVVALKRNHETILPQGNDVIKANDIVYFILTKKDIPFLRELTGKEEVNIKNIMIMGASRICLKTCQYLPSNIKVKIIEKDKEKAHDILEELSNVVVINGDGRDLELLKEEGIQHMDAFIAVTGSSEANVLACLTAKRYGVKKTIAEVENIDYISLAENLDIGTIINKKIITASYIYQLTLDADVTEIKCLTNVDVDVIEFSAKLNSLITKKKVKNLKLPKDFNIGGIIRNGEGMIVNGDTKIEAEDHVIVFCHASKIRKTEKYFN